MSTSQQVFRVLDLEVLPELNTLGFHRECTFDSQFSLQIQNQLA